MNFESPRHCLHKWYIKPSRGSICVDDIKFFHPDMVFLHAIKVRNRAIVRLEFYKTISFAHLASYLFLHYLPSAKLEESIDRTEVRHIHIYSEINRCS